MISQVAKPNNIGQNNFKVKKLFELSTISKFKLGESSLSENRYFNFTFISLAYS